MWSEERVAILRKDWAEGLSASQIAKRLGGVTRNAVIGKIHRIGLAGRLTPFRPASKKRAKYVEPAPSPEIDTLNVPILEVSDFQCKAIVDTNEWGNAKCCGQPTTSCESSWCLGHEAMFFNLHDRKAKAA